MSFDGQMLGSIRVRLIRIMRTADVRGVCALNKLANHGLAGNPVLLGDQLDPKRKPMSNADLQWLEDWTRRWVVTRITAETTLDTLKDPVWLQWINTRATTVGEKAAADEAVKLLWTD